VAQDWFAQHAPSTTPPAGGGDWFTQNRPADFSTENERDATGAPVVRASAPSRFVTSFLRQVNPLPAIKGANDALASSIQQVLSGDPQGAASSLSTSIGGVVQGMGQAQGRLAEEARQAFEAGDYLTASRKALHYLVPVLGPALDEGSEQMMAGDTAGGLGTSLGIGTAVGGPAALSQIRSAQAVPRMSRRPPQQAEAVNFMLDEGVPVDVATATGNRFNRAVQEASGYTPAGALVAESSARGQAAGLARVGERLAERTTGVRGPGSMEQAGTAVREAVEGRIQALDKTADAAYGQLRAMERNPKYGRSIETQPEVRRTTSDGRSAVVQPRVVESVPMAVDVAASKAQLKPIYDALMREAELVTLQGGRGRALTALDRLMRGPDTAPLSVVDSALSDLKALARGAEMPELRTRGQGVAAEAVSALDRQVRDAARASGPEVYDALMRGRGATLKKYGIAELRDFLKAEPVGTVRSLIASGDAGIVKLRRIAQEFPETAPQMGRAALDAMLEPATAAGGFERQMRLWNDWQRLGPQTKQLLFGAEHVKDLDRFFLGAKLLAERANPSGTALTRVAIGSTAGMAAMYTNPLSTIALLTSTGALSAALHSPKVARALARGVRVPLGNRVAAAASAAEIATLSREMGLLPMRAEARHEEAATQPGARP
jgi:hypothetical protein